eukprot:gene12397-13677_t
MDNALCLSDNNEHKLQRRDYGVIIGRVITKHIDCLKFLEDVSVKHIKHQYSKENSYPTKTLLLNMIYANENDSDGIQKVLQELHSKYVAHADGGSEEYYDEQAFVADQLSVERAVNCLMQLKNGFTPEQSLFGIHMGAADFHGAMKFFQVGFDHFYSDQMSNDKCTMLSDKVLINRRNLSTDVGKKYSSCKKFFFLEVKARILAAALKMLNLKSFSDRAEDTILPPDLKNESFSTRKSFLENMSYKIVDEFVINEASKADFAKQQRYNDWLQTCNPRTEDGKFKCCLQSCGGTFKHDVWNATAKLS